MILLFQIHLIRPSGQPLRAKGHKDGAEHAGDEGVTPSHEPKADEGQACADVG